MIRLGIIGAGTVFFHQLAALKKLSNHYRIRIVCDTDPQRLEEARLLLNGEASTGVTFCRSVQELQPEQVDAILISTPPQTHFDLAMECLKQGIDVLLEKPAVLSLNELESLYAQANEKNAILHVGYHAAFATDLQWYIEHQNELKNRYSLGEISRVYCGFYDPYIINGFLLLRKSELMGSYIDSGVNQLSVCRRIVEIEDFSAICHDVTTDRDGVVTDSQTLFSNKKTELHLDTDWTLGLNRKRTVIQYRAAAWQIVLDHSNQRVLLQPAESKKNVLDTLRNAKEIDLKRGSALLFEDTTQSRLERQYLGVFLDFETAFLNRTANQTATRSIHRLLLSNHLLNSSAH